MSGDDPQTMIAGGRAFARGESSYVAGLAPPDALGLPVTTVVELLRRRYGEVVDAVLGGEAATVARPVSADADPSWLARTRMIGVNIRTVGSYWRVVHYLLTVPAIYDSIHLLPIWEPGVAGSLYAMASWELNDKFVDAELADAFPALRTADAQLGALTSIIHLHGRAVGLDVIPHTDRYSQIVLTHPHYFEWLRRRGTRIVDHSLALEETVADEIYAFLEEAGPAGPAPKATTTPPRGSGAGPGRGAIPPRDEFFTTICEHERNALLFGPASEPALRSRRRDEIVTRLYERGLEPVPATMAPPFRGLEVDPRSTHRDTAGRVWYDYRITEPQSMSRVFGPLTRYRFYGRVDDNARWKIDFNSPRPEVFDYLAGHVRNLVDRYGFDFMRGDMSHVQMRPIGVPVEPGDHYDPLRYVKRAVRRTRPSFAYFAETFLAPPGIMGYGDEVDHLEASEAEVTLGDLQSVGVGGNDFLPRLRRYLDIASTRRVVPSFTVMTGDKDDPRFDEFYLDGNELRTFISLFLRSMPSYTALGFELRDRHDQPAANEHYTKLYVFHEESGPRATKGPYRFGTNRALFHEIERIRSFAEGLAARYPVLESGREDVTWLLHPDATAGSRVIAWSLRCGEADLLFLANTDTSSSVDGLHVPLPRPASLPRTARLAFATPAHAHAPAGSATLPVRGDRLRIETLVPGEARIYLIAADTAPTEAARDAS